MAVPFDRFSCRQFHPAAGEAFIISRSYQLAVQTRRRDFQYIRTAGNRIFNIENRTYFAAQVCTVLVRNTFRLINNNAKHSRFAAATKLDIHNFQTAGVRYPLGNLADSLHLKRHRTSTLRVTADHSNKSGLSPTGVFRQILWYYTTVSLFQIYAALGQKTTRSGKWCILM